MSDMRCPKCDYEQAETNSECPSCGIIFDKYKARQDLYPGNAASPEEEGREPSGLLFVIRKAFFYVKPETDPVSFAGRVLVFVVILIWGWRFILSSMESNYVGTSFMHIVNLPFHEAGHVFLRPCGQFIMMLGGTLGQLVIPLICLVVFLAKTRDTFGASVSLWWFAQNFMDIAPYINDARSRKLILLGGVTGRDVTDYHDWEFILRHLGWLKLDHTLATVSFNLGRFLMLTALAWGGYCLYQQFISLRHRDSVTQLSH